METKASSDWSYLGEEFTLITSEAGEYVVTVTINGTVNGDVQISLPDGYGGYAPVWGDEGLATSITVKHTVANQVSRMCITVADDWGNSIAADITITVTKTA